MTLELPFFGKNYEICCHKFNSFSGIRSTILKVKVRILRYTIQNGYFRAQVSQPSKQYLRINLLY